MTCTGSRLRSGRKRSGAAWCPGGPPLLILGVLGLAPLALGAAALARTHSAADAFLTAAGLYLVLLSCLRVLRRDRLTRAGRAALAGWLGFRLALTDLDRAGVLRTALFIAGDRRAAYAVALGAARPRRPRSGRTAPGPGPATAAGGIRSMSAARAGRGGGGRPP